MKEIDNLYQKSLKIKSLNKTIYDLLGEIELILYNPNLKN
jgi:hypothetical protein